MGRESRKAMEKAYREVYKIPSSFKLRNKDYKIMNNALPEIAAWQGYFPGEVNEKDIYNFREADKGAQDGTPDSLLRYFTKLGLRDESKTDWVNIFTIYKEYVGADPTGERHPKNSDIITQTSAAIADDVADTNNVEEERTVLTDVADEVEELMDIKIKTEEGELKEMASIQDIMQDSTGRAAAMQQELAAGANMGFGNTNVSAGGHDRNKEYAEKRLEEEKAVRRDWTANNKVSMFVFASEPLAARIPENVTEGKIKNPKDQLNSILKKVWANETAPSGMVNGMVDGQVVVPDCVTKANSGESYSQIITILNDAINGGKDTMELSKSNKFGQFKGIVYGPDKTPKNWKDIAEVIVKNGYAIMEVEANSDVQLQLTVLSQTQLEKKKNIKGAEDLVMLKVAGKSELVDTKEGVIKDASLVKLVYTTDKSVTKLEEQRTVNSKLSFRYIQPASASQVGAQSRTMTRAVKLICEQYAKKAPADGDILSAFVSHGGGVGVVNKLSEEAQGGTLLNVFMMEAAKNVMDPTGQVMMGELKKNDQAAQAQAASEAADLL